MIKSLLLFNPDEATKFTDYLETLKDELQHEDTYNKLMEEIKEILKG
jgi:hypothetical protein